MHTGTNTIQNCWNDGKQSCKMRAQYSKLNCVSANNYLKSKLKKIISFIKNETE